MLLSGTAELVLDNKASRPGGATCQIKEALDKVGVGVLILTLTEFQIRTGMVIFLIR